MTARLLDGKAAASAIRDETAAGVGRLRRERGVVPGLTVVLVGEDPASQVYTRNKVKTSGKMGMRSDLVRLPAETAEEELLRVLDRLNADPSVHGILVQLPLPRQIDAHRIAASILPEKDVDGLNPVNAGRLMLGQDGFVPCTPAGIVELLRRNDIPMEGRSAVIIGRSNIVGKPLAQLLLRENATVTVCHSRTRDLAAVAAGAEILVASIGRKALVRAEHIREGAVVVDVGINRCESEEEARDLFDGDATRLTEISEKGYTLVGDVHPAEAMRRASWFTPVPGGVGPLTIAMLMKNTLRAAGGS